jgi:SecD/SecF fusion protein
MQHTRTYLTAAVIVLLLAVAGMFLRGFNFGVEFTGGRVVEYSTTQDVSVNQARRVVEDAGYPTAVVQQSNEENITVRPRRSPTTRSRRSAPRSPGSAARSRSTPTTSSDRRSAASCARRRSSRS